MSATEQNTSLSELSERILCEMDLLPTLPESALSIAVNPSNALDLKTLMLIAEGDSYACSATLENGFIEEITSGREFVDALGLPVAGQILVMRSLITLFSRSDVDESAAQRQRAIWTHSLSAACAAFMIAERLNIRLDPQTAFFMGMLHDVGKAALVSAFPKSYSRVEVDSNLSLSSSCEMERAIFGTDHAMIGRRIASRWRLPQRFVDCIWLHHCRVDALPSSVARQGHVQAVVLANVLAHEQHSSLMSNSIGGLSSNLVGRSLGLSPDVIGEIAGRLPEEIKKRESWLGLGGSPTVQASSMQLRQRLAALSTSHASLQKEHERSRRSARLSSIINLFNQRIDANTSTADFCKLAAGTLKSFFQTSGVAVFFDRPSISALNVGLAEGDKEEFEIIEAPGELDFSLQTLSSSPTQPLIMSPGDEVLGLINRYRDWLGPNEIQFFPIRLDNRPIGGAVLSGASGFLEIRDQVALLHSLSAALARAAGLVRSNEETMALSDELALINRRMADARSESLSTQITESLAATTAGIAHELNNPLALISGRAQMLLPEVQDARVRNTLEQIIRQANAAADIISDVNEVSGPTITSPREVDLAELLRKLRTELISQGLLAEHQITLDLPVRSLVLFFDPDLLRRIFRELLDNALQATDPDTRLLTIKARFNLAEEQIAVVVADNGRGMKPEVLDRAMDPFFSHRPAGRGRGMGLARVNRWLRSGRGSIRIKSAPQRGTQVELILLTRP